MTLRIFIFYLSLPGLALADCSHLPQVRALVNSWIASQQHSISAGKIAQSALDVINSDRELQTETPVADQIKFIRETDDYEFVECIEKISQDLEADQLPVVARMLLVAGVVNSGNDSLRSPGLEVLEGFLEREECSPEMKQFVEESLALFPDYSRNNEEPAKSCPFYLVEWAKRLVQTIRGR